jgi:hypothetical protein
MPIEFVPLDITNLIFGFVPSENTVNKVIKSIKQEINRNNRNCTKNEENNTTVIKIIQGQ